MKKAAKPDFGQSLADTNPKLAQQWHPTKNGDLTPFDVKAGSTLKVWWKCPKGKDHEWSAVVADRNRGIGCAVCSNYKVVESNCLATLNPTLASEWHPTKNSPLTPKDVHPGSSRKIWWLCSKGDDHVWAAKVYSRNLGRGCPICDGKKVVASTCLATLNPNLAKEWHPTKNSKNTPYNTGPNSKKIVWWKCPHGEDHEWKASVNNRNRGLGCPICSNQKVTLSNCLATLNPELAKQWHPTKNGTLTPFDVVPGSSKVVWWKCPEGEDHEWKSDIKRRSLGRECPICIGRKVVDSNSFATLYPELASQFHPSKNGGLNPNNYRPYSNKKVWWQCSRIVDHVWEASFNMRVQGTGCPMCNSPKSAPELRTYCELKTIFPDAESRVRINGWEIDIYIPSLRVGIEYDGWYWHREKTESDRKKNYDVASEISLLRVREHGLERLGDSDILLDRRELTLAGFKLLLNAILELPWIEPTTEYRLLNYLKREKWAAETEFHKIQFENNGLVFERSLSHLDPELSSEWDFQKNHPLTPENVTPASHKKVWWRDRSGRCWRATIASRAHKRQRDLKNKPKNQYDLFEEY
jgi:hypothetical protein